MGKKKKKWSCQAENRTLNFSGQSDNALTYQLCQPDLLISCDLKLGAFLICKEVLEPTPSMFTSANVMSNRKAGANVFVNSLICYKRQYTDLVCPCCILMLFQLISVSWGGGAYIVSTAGFEPNGCYKVSLQLNLNRNNRWLHVRACPRISKLSNDGAGQYLDG